MTAVAVMATSALRAKHPPRDWACRVGDGDDTKDSGGDCDNGLDAAVDDDNHRSNDITHNNDEDDEPGPCRPVHRTPKISSSSSSSSSTSAAAAAAPAVVTPVALTSSDDFARGEGEFRVREEEGVGATEEAEDEDEDEKEQDQDQDHRPLALEARMLLRRQNYGAAAELYGKALRALQRRQRRRQRRRSVGKHKDSGILLGREAIDSTTELLRRIDEAAVLCNLALCLRKGGGKGTADDAAAATAAAYYREGAAIYRLCHDALLLRRKEGPCASKSDSTRRREGRRTRQTVNIEVRAAQALRGAADASLAAAAAEGKEGKCGMYERVKWINRAVSAHEEIVAFLLSPGGGQGGNGGGGVVFCYPDDAALLFSVSEDDDTTSEHSPPSADAALLPPFMTRPSRNERLVLVSRSLNDLGSLHLRRGDVDSAAASIADALDLLRGALNIKDKCGKNGGRGGDQAGAGVGIGGALDPAGTLPLLREVAQTLHGKAELCMVLNDADGEVEALREALQTEDAVLFASAAAASGGKGNGGETERGRTGGDRGESKLDEDAAARTALALGRALASRSSSADVGADFAAEDTREAAECYDRALGALRPDAEIAAAEYAEALEELEDLRRRGAVIRSLSPPRGRVKLPIEKSAEKEVAGASTESSVDVALAVAQSRVSARKDVEDVPGVEDESDHISGIDSSTETSPKEPAESMSYSGFKGGHEFEREGERMGVDRYPVPVGNDAEANYPHYQVWDDSVSQVTFPEGDFMHTPPKSESTPRYRAACPGRGGNDAIVEEAGANRGVGVKQSVADNGRLGGSGAAGWFAGLPYRLNLSLAMDALAEVTEDFLLKAGDEGLGGAGAGNGLKRGFGGAPEERSVPISEITIDVSGSVVLTHASGAKGWEAGMGREENGDDAFQKVVDEAGSGASNSLVLKSSIMGRPPQTPKYARRSFRPPSPVPHQEGVEVCDIPGVGDVLKRKIFDDGDDDEDLLGRINVVSPDGLDTGENSGGARPFAEVMRRGDCPVDLDEESLASTQSGSRGIPALVPVASSFDAAAEVRALTEALRDRRSALGLDHPSVAELLPRIARVFQRRGEPKKAEGLLMEAARIFRSTIGRGGPKGANREGADGGWNRPEGRARAAGHLSETLLLLGQVRSDIYGAGSDAVLSAYSEALSELGSARAGGGKPVAAEEGPVAAEVLRRMGAAFLERGDYERSMRCYERALRALMGRAAPSAGEGACGGLFDEKSVSWQRNCFRRHLGPDVCRTLIDLGSVYYKERNAVGMLPPISSSDSAKENDPNGAIDSDIIRPTNSENFVRYVRSGALMLVAAAHVERGEYAVAMRFLEETLQRHSNRECAEDEENNESLRLISFLYNRIGELSLRTGQYDEALERHREALRIQRKLLQSAGSSARTSPDIAETTTLIGDAEMKRGKYRRALSAFESALPVQREALSHASRDTGGKSDGKFGGAYAETEAAIAATLRGTGSVHDELFEHDRAMACFEEALRIQRRIYSSTSSSVWGDGDSPEVLKTRICIGKVHLARANLDAAMSTFENVLMARRSLYHGSHPDIAEAIYCVGVCHAKRGEMSDAMDAYRTCYSMRTSALGHDHPDVAVTLNSIGAVYYSAGRRDRAMAIYDDALRIKREVFGDEHIEISRTLVNQGLVLASKGNYAEAMAKYTEALHMRQESLGTRHPAVADIHTNIGNVHMRRCAFAEAAVRFDMALTIYRSKLAESHPKVKRTLRTIERVKRDEQLCV